MRATLMLSGLFATVLMTVYSVSSLAVEREPGPETEVLKPATRYSGGTPVDLHHGLLFNNGTQGVRNDDYESWARSPMVVAGLSERPYSYGQKSQFLNVINEQVQWGEAAINNWKNTSNEFPDALAYSKAAVDKMSPVLDHLKSAAKDANGAGQNDWASKESGARRALVDFRMAYMEMHKNVQARQLKK